MRTKSKPFRDMSDAELISEFHHWGAEVQAATGWGASLAQAARWRDECAEIMRERGIFLASMSVEPLSVSSEHFADALAGTHHDLYHYLRKHLEFAHADAFVLTHIMQRLQQMALQLDALVSSVSKLEVAAQAVPAAAVEDPAVQATIDQLVTRVEAVIAALPKAAQPAA